MRAKAIQPVTDEEIAQAFAGSNFGHLKHRELLAASVFKKLVGYNCGHTVTTIMTDMRLIGIKGAPTERGRSFVAETYAHLMTVSG
ncbi:MAG: hypothetical protein V4718_00635 [Pseudomonadota bacterium]